MDAPMNQKQRFGNDANEDRFKLNSFLKAVGVFIPIIFIPTQIFLNTVF